jgi:hypothetical protein
VGAEEVPGGERHDHGGTDDASSRQGSVDPLVTQLAELFGGVREPSAARLVGIDDREEIVEEAHAPVDRRALERRFHGAMIEVYQRARSETGYNATRFIKMIAELGGLETARLLLSARDPSEGFVTLVQSGRVDLTVEALALDPSYAPLFTDAQLESARRRVRESRG